MYHDRACFVILKQFFFLLNMDVFQVWRQLPSTYDIIIPEFLYPFLSLDQRQLIVGLSFRHLSLAVIYFHEVSYLDYSAILIVKLQRVSNFVSPLP